MLQNDYELVVLGLSTMLAPFTGRVSVVDLAVHGGSSEQADVLLYDTFSHETDLAAVLASGRAHRVVVYTWSGNESQIAEALAAGASGYLTKGLEGAAIVDALERVHAGEVVIDAGIRERETALGEDWPGRTEGLSAREAEIVAWIAAGYNNIDVAERAFLSINTVKTYIRSAYRKMHVSSRSQAVLWAVDHGFTTSPSAPPRFGTRPSLN